MEHGPDDGGSSAGAGVERGFLKDAEERDSVFAVNGQKRKMQASAEAGDGIPGDDVAVYFLRVADARMRVNARADDE